MSQADFAKVGEGRAQCPCKGEPGPPDMLSCLTCLVSLFLSGGSALVSFVSKQLGCQLYNSTRCLLPTLKPCKDIQAEHILDSSSSMQASSTQRFSVLTHMCVFCLPVCLYGCAAAHEGGGILLQWCAAH